MAKAAVVTLSIGLVSFVAVSAQASSGETIVGLTYLGGGAGQLYTINSAAPGTMIAPVGISGTIGGDVIVDITYWGSTLYGVGSGGNLYTLNLGTGVATLVNHFGTLNGNYVGIDAESGGIRIVSNSDINLLVDPSTGSLISTDPTLNPGSPAIDAISVSGGTTYAVDSVANTLGTLNPATGVFSTIGGMGYDVSGKNGFVISPGTGIAYFASGVSSSGTDANLYQVNLATGFASLVGTIGSSEGLLNYGLAIAPVPEPSSIALALFGGAGVLALARRRK
jgi:hypothetical protein